MRIPAAIVVLLFSSGLFAQECDSCSTIFFGPMVSYTFGSPVSIQREAEKFDIFSTGGQGISWDNSGSIGARVSLPKLFSERYGLAASIRYIVGSGTFKSVEFSNAGHPSDFRIESNYHALEVSAMATAALSKKWYVGTGGYLSYRIKSNLIQYLYDLSTDTSKDIARGEQLGTPKLHFGIPLAIGGRFPISNNLYISAESVAQFDVGEIIRGFSATAFGMGFSLGLAWDLEPPEVAEPGVAPENIFRTSVFFTVNGVSTRQATSNTVDSFRRRYIVLPSVVEFTDKITTIRYHILTKEQTDSFDISSLDRTSPVMCYREILNIIGRRLRDFPKERIILTSADRDNAQTILKYFTSVWSVDPEQISIGSSASANVTIGGSMKILSPLINEWHDEFRQTPEITVEKVITSSAGIKNWTLEIRDGDQTISTYDNSDPSSEKKVASLSERTIDTVAHTFHAKLTAKDSIGGLSEASDSIRILPAQSLVHSMASSESYFILADSLANQVSWSSLLLDKLVKSVTARTTIIITPVYLPDIQLSGLVSKLLIDRLQKDGVTAKEIRINNNSNPNLPVGPISSLVEIKITR